MSERQPYLDDLDAVSGRALTPICVAFAAVYAFLALAQPWLAPKPVPLPIFGLQAATSIVGWGLVLWSLRVGISKRWAHPTLLLMAALMALNLVVYALWGEQPESSVFNVLAMIGVASSMLSRPYCAAGIGLIVVAWWIPTQPEGVLSPEWRHWTGFVGASVVGSWCILEFRRRFVRGELELRALAEQKVEIERALQEGQRRESLGVLAGGLAHDLNNLLTVVVGNLEIVQLQSGGDAEVDRCLHDALGATERATRLTAQMLTYAGKRQPRRGAVDLQDRVASAVDLFRSTVPVGVTLDAVRDREPCWVDGDATLIDQLLVNLIGNALDACGAKGTGRVAVRAGVVELDDPQLRTMRSAAAAQAGSFVRIEVSDEGGGMPEAVARQAFEPFFTTKGSGTGLGLSMVDTIAIAHAGAVELETQEGEGTRVRVYLPQGKPAEAEPEVRSLPGPGRGRVLVVDDEPEILRLAERILEREGYRVSTACGGEEAIAVAKQAGELRAALIDLTMPGDDGLSVASALSVLRPDLPIVLMTGFDRAGAIARFGEPLPYPLLMKPFDRQSLASEIAAALRRHTAADPEAKGELASTF